jgi:hypothetical protein
MTNIKRMTVCMYLVLLGVFAVQADELYKRTVVTFSAPVEIPGKVLTPGTYVFKLFDSQSGRNIVQVWNKEETQLIATLLAVPDYRLPPPDNPVITFEQRAKDSPPAIRAWFYPGDTYGFEFVYPKTRATELATANHQNVPSMANSMADHVSKSTNSKASPGVVALGQTHVTAMTPEKNEVEVEEAIQTNPNSSSNRPR